MVESGRRGRVPGGVVSEHHLIHYISCPSPLMMVVQAASRTRRIRLGTAILVIPYYNRCAWPARSAWPTCLTGGRLEIGVRRGAFEYEFDRFGIDETIAAARAARRHGHRARPAHRGGLLVPGRDLLVRPGHRGAAPAAVALPADLRSPRVSRHDHLGHPERLQSAVDAVARAVRARAGPVTRRSGADRRSRAAVPPRFAVSRMTFVGADRRRGAGCDERDPDQPPDVHPALQEPGRREAPASPAPSRSATSSRPSSCLANLVAGSPETCVEKLRRYEALGVDHFIMYAAFGADHAATMKSLRLFAERVHAALHQLDRPGVSPMDRGASDAALPTALPLDRSRAGRRRGLWPLAARRSPAPAKPQWVVAIGEEAESPTRRPACCSPPRSTSSTSSTRWSASRATTSSPSACSPSSGKQSTRRRGASTCGRASSSTTARRSMPRT